MSVSTKPTPLQKCRALWVEQGWPFWIGIIGLVALFVLLRWNNFNVPLIRDEGDYAYSGQLLIRGLAPYEHAFVQKPPLVIYSYALSNLLLPDLFWSPRLLAYLFVALATALLGYIARLEFGKGFARLAPFPSASAPDAPGAVPVRAVAERARRPAIAKGWVKNRR